MSDCDEWECNECGKSMLDRDGTGVCKECQEKDRTAVEWIDGPEPESDVPPEADFGVEWKCGICGKTLGSEDDVKTVGRIPITGRMVFLCEDCKDEEKKERTTCSECGVETYGDTCQLCSASKRWRRSSSRRLPRSSPPRQVRGPGGPRGGRLAAGGRRMNPVIHKYIEVTRCFECPFCKPANSPYRETNACRLDDDVVPRTSLWGDDVLIPEKCPLKKQIVTVVLGKE